MQHSAAEERISLAGRARLLIRLIRIGLTRMKTQKRRPGWAGFVELLKLKWEDFRIGWAVFRGRSKDAQLHLLRTTLSQFHLQHGYHIYDYLSRVPFVVAGVPEMPAGRNVESQVRNIDILPTLIEMFAFDAPTPTWHGVSFAAHLRNGRRDERPLYMEARGGAQATHAFYIRGVRAGGHKLAFAPHDPQAPAELYDVHADPGELRNLAAEMPDVVARLRDEAETMARAFQSTEQSAGLSEAEQAAMIEKLKSLGYM
jgi:hypothetical protein